MTLRTVRLAEGLGFAEGPLALDDGRIVFCDGSNDRLVQYNAGRVTPYADLAGPPNAAALAADGSVYVTQVGRTPAERPPGVAPGIERVRAGGVVERVATVVAGWRLIEPNDLAFGPDGRLFFTDSGGPYEPGVDGPGGRIFALDADGGECLLELSHVYPNGVAFDSAGRLLWTESYPRRLWRLEQTGPRMLHEFPPEHVPDGLAVAADGRIFVATLSSGGVSVLSPEGAPLGHLPIGGWPTNCAFARDDLIVTAVADVTGDDATGSLWRLEVGVAGLPLHVGEVALQVSD